MSDWMRTWDGDWGATDNSQTFLKKGNLSFRSGISPTVFEQFFSSLKAKLPETLQLPSFINATAE